MNNEISNEFKFVVCFNEYLKLEKTDSFIFDPYSAIHEPLDISSSIDSVLWKASSSSVLQKFHFFLNFSKQTSNAF